MTQSTGLQERPGEVMATFGEYYDRYTPFPVWWAGSLSRIGFFFNF